MPTTTTAPYPAAFNQTRPEPADGYRDFFAAAEQTPDERAGRNALLDVIEEARDLADAHDVLVRRLAEIERSMLESYAGASLAYARAHARWVDGGRHNNSDRDTASYYAHRADGAMSLISKALNVRDEDVARMAAPIIEEMRR